MRWQAVAASFLLALALPAAVLAQAPDRHSKYVGTFIEDDWNVIAGLFSASFDTEASFSPNGPIGGLIRLESDLGLESNIDTGFVGGSHRFNERHRLAFSATNLDRTATRTISRDIELPDATYRVGATIGTKLDTRLFQLKWMYNVARSDRLAAGFEAGLSTFDFGLVLNGVGEIDDGQGGVRLETVEEVGDFIAPVPLIGMFIDYAIEPRLIIRASVEAIKFSISGHAGHVLESNFAVEYYITRLFGLGAGFASTDIEYSENTNNSAIRAAYRLDSLNFYVTFVF